MGDFEHHVIHQGTAVDASTILRRRRNACVTGIRVLRGVWNESHAKRAWKRCCEAWPGDDGIME